MEAIMYVCYPLHKQFDLISVGTDTIFHGVNVFRVCK